MLCLQFAIGAANDLADASRDRLTRSDKPLVAGLVRTGEARAVLAVSALAGLAWAASAGIPALALALTGLGDGLLYDLRLKGTALSWLPFAAGVALLPAYAWLGATGSLPPAFWAIALLALLAGTSLALANAVADLQHDALAGVASVATVLGRRGSITANGLLLAVLQLAVAASTAAAGSYPLSAMAMAEAAGAVLGWAGLLATASANERLSRLGWEIQAVGVAVMGAAWMAILAAAGELAS